MVRDVMDWNLARFPWEELRAENVRFLFRVIYKHVVSISKWGKKVSAAALACFGQAPDILGINRLI
jgi:hypothetical protein